MKGSCLFPVASNTSSMTRRNILATSMPGYVRCFASPRLTRPHRQAAISFIVRCVLSYHYAFTQRQCLTPDTVWYLATVPFPQAGMPLPGCEALAADCWPAPVFLALADIVVAPNANAVTKIPINSFDVDTRLSSDCLGFSSHLTRNYAHFVVTSLFQSIIVPVTYCYDPPQRAPDALVAEFCQRHTCERSKGWAK